jgi:hemolysin activation/secretion protein
MAGMLATPAVPVAAQSAAQILPPTREEVTRPEAPTPPARAPRLEVEGGIERAPCALDNPDYKDIKFTLRGVEFEGLQGIASDELAPSYATMVGREHPISVVCEVRDRAATILRNAGYIAAVQVPEQRIADGVVRFRVLMAKLTQVRVRGNATGAEKTIAGYLGQLTKQPVFNRFEAERYLLLASDLPGYNVRLTLRPAGGEPGEVVGDVTVQRVAAFADLNIQNAGSRELGRWGGLLRGQMYGLTGLGDRTTASFYTTSDLEEQQTIQLGHDFRIGGEGMGASGMFTYAWARPSIPDGDVDARTLLATLEVNYPFIRTQASTLRGAAGLDIVNQDVQLDNIDLTRDRLRVGFLRLGWDALSMDFSKPGRSLIEPFWRLSNIIELRQGLGFLGASDCGPVGVDCDISLSRPEGRPTATVIRYNGYGEIRPLQLITFALGVRAQYAWKPLLSFEEFSAGNYTVGRGYDPGALLGDRGWGTQAELRFGTRVPPSAKSAAIEGFAFWDHAKVNNLDKIGVVPQPNRLNSIGGGARLLFDRFALDGTVAVPLTRIGPDYDKQDLKFLLSLTTRLWPWSYK